MSGLEVLQAIRDGKLSEPAMAKTIPMTFVEVEPGKVLFHARADERHLNPMGGVHGGFAAAVLDSVTGCAIHTLLDAGVGYGTIELDIKMMRPVPKDMRLIAEGKVINLSRSVGFADSSLRDEQGKIYAHGTATCLIVRPGS